jgi:predicted ATP-binding protein involved in virulence
VIVLKIKEIVLENFRGFRHLHLHFQEKNVVLVGTNGVGKSTILHAAIILLSRFVEALSYGVAKKITLNESDIKSGKEGLKIKCTLHYKGMEREIELMITKAGGPNRRPKLSARDESGDLVDFLQKKLAEGNFNAPIFVNYPVHRHVSRLPAKIKARKGAASFSAYHDCFADEMEFSSFFEWYLHQDFIERMNKIEHGPNYHDKELQAVRNAIYNFMPGFSRLEILRDGKTRMVITKGSQRLEINQLSNGEKCLLAMIGDLALRLVLANPDRENPLEGDGIVFIDEIELHLHPAMQREIINRLQETFPNIQFFLSTHSPQVLGELHSAQVFFVTQTEDGEDIEVESVPTLFGKDSNLILEQFMGAAEKNEEIKQKQQRLFQLLAESKLVEARKLMNHLIGILGSDDPNLIKADMILRRKESLRR